MAIKLVKINYTEGDFFFLDEHFFSSKVFTKTRSEGQNITEGEQWLTTFDPQSNTKATCNGMHATVCAKEKRKKKINGHR